MTELGNIPLKEVQSILNDCFLRSVGVKLFIQLFKLHISQVRLSLTENIFITIKLRIENIKTKGQFLRLIKHP